MPAQPELPPEAFAEKPGLEDMIYVVNANTQRVQRLQTENATLHVDGIPAMRANLAFEQPANFRLLGTAVPIHRTGTRPRQQSGLVLVLDSAGEQPSVYFASHDAFASSPDPRLDSPRAESPGRYAGADLPRTRGPAQRSGGAEGLLEITSRIPSAHGEMTRVMLVDAKYGWPAQQHLYDAAGQLLLSTRAANSGSIAKSR